MKSLTPKQMRFCELYVQTGNATQSYKDAGYDCNDRTALVEASKALIKPHIALYIGQLKKEISEKHEISTDRVIKELVKSAFGDLDEVISIDDDGKFVIKKDANIKMLESVSQSESESSSSEGSSYSKSFSVKRSDKIKALDMLCKLTGLYERRDTDSELGKSINSRRILDALSRFREKK